MSLRSSVVAGEVACISYSVRGATSRFLSANKVLQSRILQCMDCTTPTIWWRQKFFEKYLAQSILEQLKPNRAGIYINKACYANTESE